MKRVVEYRKLTQEDSVSFSNEASVEVVVSFSYPIRISPDMFMKFDGGLLAHGHHQMRGRVALERIREWSGQQGISVILAQGAALSPQPHVVEEALVVA